MHPNFSLMIPGATTDDGELEIVAPFDRAVIATATAADGEAVDRALETASRLFRDRGAWLKPYERIEILGRAAAIKAERADELAVEAAREGGKPLIDSKVEVARAIDGVKNCIEVLRTEAGKEIPMNLNAASAGRMAFTRKQPIGVVVAVSAFNHPLNLIVHQVGPAVATGCPVIIKPAEDTPLSCLQTTRTARRRLSLGRQRRSAIRPLARLKWRTGRRQRHPIDPESRVIINHHSRRIPLIRPAEVLCVRAKNFCPRVCSAPTRRLTNSALSVGKNSRSIANSRAATLEVNVFRLSQLVQQFLAESLLNRARTRAG